MDKEQVEALEDFIQAEVKYHMFKLFVKTPRGEKLKKLSRDSVEELDWAKKNLLKKFG